MMLTDRWVLIGAILIKDKNQALQRIILIKENCFRQRTTLEKKKKTIIRWQLTILSLASPLRYVSSLSYILANFPLLMGNRRLKTWLDLSSRRTLRSSTRHACSSRLDFRAPLAPVETSTGATLRRGPTVETQIARVNTPLSAMAQETATKSPLRKLGKVSIFLTAAVLCLG